MGKSVMTKSASNRTGTAKETHKKTPQKAQLKAIKHKQTKREIMSALTAETGLARRDIEAVLNSVGKMAQRHVMKAGSGEFAIPEMGIKVRRVARKARKSRNPQTGELVEVPAKSVVKATILKSLKQVAA